MLVINKDNVLDILQATVDKYATDGDPSATYRECEYVDLNDDPERFGAPVCVVGCALVDAGVPVTTFTGYTGVGTRTNYEKIGVLIEAGLFDDYVQVEDNIAAVTIARAQSDQDASLDWDTMMRNARQRYTVITGTDY